MKKRKHHYVWEHYLRAWATDDQIWCRRANKSFQTSTENVAHRRDFYRLKELSDVDVVFVERLISAMGESAHDMARSWIPYFRTFHKMKQDWTASGRSNPEFEDRLDVAINNMEEELHAAIEGPAVPTLAALRQGNATSLKDDETFGHFAWFIATQYMRTPRRAQSAAKAVGAVAPSFNLDAAWGLLRTIFSSNMGAALYVRRNNVRLTYLRAAQPSFVTGDQPVVNVRAADLPDGTPPTELELYYPLSPHLAVSMAFEGETRSVEYRSLEAAEIARYNNLIARASGNQIYASNEAALRVVQP